MTTGGIREGLAIRDCVGVGKAAPISLSVSTCVFVSWLLKRVYTILNAMNENKEQDNSLQLNTIEHKVV